MPLQYIECFGQRPDSDSLGYLLRKGECPFVGGKCIKKFRGGPISGACTLALQSASVPVICCPKRLYANSYQVLRDVAESAFGPGIPLVVHGEERPGDCEIAIPFGQKQGREIRVPHQFDGSGSKFSVDWIIARVSSTLELIEFVAVEVQTIDTTGSYQHEFWAIAEKFAPDVIETFEKPPRKSSSFNYENVNKRILPQLIRKGHILRGERLCTKGLYFVCPTPVIERVLQRVGKLPEFPQQTGSITFMGYQVDLSSDVSPWPLCLERCLTTTTEQLSVAFSSAIGLPAAGVYEVAIRKALAKRFK